MTEEATNGGSVRGEPEKNDKMRTEPAEGEAKAPGKEVAVEGVARIKYDHFAKVELKTAEILEAERVEGTDKLVCLQLALGEERRQIVAGIAEHYECADLVGKTIVIVANLKPVKLRGVKSNGMLLAASEGDTLRLVTVDGPIGSGASIR